MSQHNLKSHAVTLGIGSTTVVRKAAELCRMLDTKGHTYHKLLNLVGDAKLFICLDIAAAEHGQSFDKALSVERSCMTKKNYQNAMRSIQTLLCVNKSSSLREHAVTLGHPQLVSPASSLVKQYLDKCLAGDATLVTSGVNLAALVVAAKQEGVALKITKVMEMAACNRASFDKLKKQMEQLSQPGALKKEQVELMSQPVRSSPRKHKTPANGTVQSEVVSPKKTRLFPSDKKNKPVDTDSFEVWKDKILTSARNKLKKR